MPDRKTEIIDAAADLLQSRSFSSFSYQDTSDSSGIRMSSCHHYFLPQVDRGITRLGTPIAPS